MILRFPSLGHLGAPLTLWAWYKWHRCVYMWLETKGCPPRPQALQEMHDTIGHVLCPATQDRFLLSDAKKAFVL